MMDRMTATDRRKSQPASRHLTASEIADKLSSVHKCSQTVVRIAHPWGDSLVAVRKVRVTLGPPGEPDYVELLI